MMNKKACMLAMSGIMLGLCGTAYAQTEGAAEIPTQTGDIIVTAQKRSERLRDVPLTVVSQTGDQLVASGIINTRDLAQVVPGLTFSRAPPLARAAATTPPNATPDSRGSPFIVTWPL